jgi:hypothetical protein
METAPLDGTPIRVRNGHQQISGAWVSGPNPISPIEYFLGNQPHGPRFPAL